VTHPFHPLSGQEFDFVVHRRNWGEDRVYFLDGAGELRSLPASWTDAVAADPFVVIAAGRSPWRVVDLLALAELIGRRPAGFTKDVKPTMPDVSG
jgi:hypothetical protein